MKAVLVTGTGAVSSFGVGTEILWDNCLQGNSIVKPIPDCWQNFTSYRSSIWSPLPEIDYLKFGFSSLELTQLDPVTRISLIAAWEALERAGIEISRSDLPAGPDDLTGIDKARMGVFIGTGIGGATSMLDNYAYHIVKSAKGSLSRYPGEPDLARLAEIAAGRRRVNPFVVSMTMANATAATIGIKFGIKGINHTYPYACASATYAIGEACRAISENRLDIAIAGGCEYFADTAGGLFMSFDIARTLVSNCDDPQTANRPFDKARSGFLFGQGGCGMLVLESKNHALKRGAEVLATCTGYGESFDAFNIMSNATDGSQLTKMVQETLDDAGLRPDQIDYINAHGTGTETNDAAEAAVVERIFGNKPKINSSKSLLGHTLGASGGLEAVICVKSISSQGSHLCKNLETPVRDLNFITGPENFEIRHCMSQSFAFGGHNAALIFSRY